MKGIKTVSPGHWTDWKKKALEKNKKYGEMLDRLMVDKTEGPRLIRKLGLPHLEYSLRYKVNEFRESNPRLKEFLKSHDQFFIRAVPVKGREDLPKKPLMGIETFGAMKNFVEEFTRGNEEFYIIDVLEYHPDEHGIVINSERERLTAEISRKGLDQLCYGLVRPDIEITIDIQNKRKYWNILKQDRRTFTDRRLLLEAINFLNQGTEKSPLYSRGYFEIVVRRDKGLKIRDRILFFDATQNPNIVGEIGMPGRKYGGHYIDTFNRQKIY